MTEENQLGEILELAPATVPEPRAPQVERVPNFRASSYDLLHGLRVRDVSDKMPVRMFDALFGPDQAADPSGRNGVDTT